MSSNAITPRRSICVPVVATLILSVLGGASACRSALGIDPIKEPERAAKAPGWWRGELSNGLRAGGSEKYILQFDGTRGWISASVPTGGADPRQWGRAVSASEYSIFVTQALTLQPFGWEDRRSSSQGPFETLVLRFRCADRGRSVLIEGPDTTEKLLFERLRMLANSPPPPELLNASGGGR